MKILLTSGGTKVPIDRVRSITNMSRGTFGSKIARQLIQNEDVHLTYLGAEGFEMPFSARIDCFDEDKLSFVELIAERIGLLAGRRDRYAQVTYKTFDEYAEQLKRLVQEEKPDVVILAAAVSDFIVPNPLDGKIRSKDSLNIQLEASPKLISQIKKWHPDCRLIGFKLLVDSTDEELIEAARKSIKENDCDLVVANDLRDIKAGEHRLLIVNENFVEEYTGSSLAKIVAEKACE